MDSLRAAFLEQGFAFPVDVLSRREAERHRAALEALERRIGIAASASGGRRKEGEAAGDMRYGFREQLNQPHILFRFADEIARAPRMLDAVERILGGDIMVWSTTLLIKEPHTPAFVSWHQDLRYWGLSDAEGMCSAWLALSEATPENGCMRFLPGSHLHGLHEHDDTRHKDNSLTRGQRARVDIDEAAAVCVPLAPGQMSLHHGRLLHSSAPNRTGERRIGFITVYIAPSLRQLAAREDYAMLVRGRDGCGNFIQVPPPQADLAPEARAWHQRVLDAQDRVLYAGDAQAPPPPPPAAAASR